MIAAYRILLYQAWIKHCFVWFKYQSLGIIQSNISNSIQNLIQTK